MPLWILIFPPNPEAEKTHGLHQQNIQLQRFQRRSPGSVELISISVDFYMELVGDRQPFQEMIWYQFLEYDRFEKTTSDVSIFKNMMSCSMCVCVCQGQKLL